VKKQKSKIQKAMMVTDERDEIINYVESSDEEDGFQETFGLQPSPCK
jgi:hypothetical protein